MIHRWLVFAAVTLAAPAAFADRAVTGSVVDDATGLPVVGALVTVGDGEAATDDQGQFRVDGVAFGRVDVVVIADGYRASFGSARIAEGPGACSASAASWSTASSARTATASRSAPATRTASS